MKVTLNISCLMSEVALFLMVANLSRGLKLLNTETGQIRGSNMKTVYLSMIKMGMEICYFQVLK